MFYSTLFKAFPGRSGILLGMLFFISQVSAQGAWTIYDIFNSSLPENSVRCLAIEKNTNKLWIGTDFGLASLENGNWNVFSTLNSGLPDNRIRSLCVDPSGKKWIGTFDGGLACYNDTVWTIYNTFNSPVPDNFIKSLAMDSTSNLWIGTTGGLGRFDGTNWNVYQMFSDPIQSNNIASIRIAPDNTRWFGTINGGLARLVDSTWTIFSIQTTGIPDNSILDIRLDDLQKPWMATPAAGMIAYLGGTSWLIYNNATNSNLPFVSLHSVGILPDQTKFAGTQSHGLARLKSGIWDLYSMSNSPLPDDEVLCILEESNQVIWLGTKQGLVRLNLSVLNSSDTQYQSGNIFVGPNPTSDYLNIFSSDLADGEFRILDLSGRILITGSLNSGNEKISVSELRAGIYLVEILSDKGKFSRKFLKN